MDGQPNPVFNYGRGNVGRDKLTNVGNRVYNITNQQNIRVGADEDLLRALRELVVPEAMHDSKEVDKEATCHPGTRVIVLEDVAAWIEDLDPEFTLKWMKGAAGAGKSAIARTVAQLLAKDGLLLASFFCWRSSDARSDGARVIPTLVDQIITRIPSVRPIVEEAFLNDLHLLTKSLEIQAMRLIVEPLASIEPSLHQSLPRVIVIDGLDEIKGGEAQCDILKVVAFLIDNLPLTIHFFIASRPEHQIQECFARFMGNRWSALSLDETKHPDRDILTYYKAHFSLIVAAFPAYKYEPDWPGEAVRQVLVAKGSGQFVFAAIVIRFVGSTSTAVSPRERLKKILDNVSNDEHNPLKLLDLVYVTVFEAIPKEELKAVLQLVGLVLLPEDFKKSPQVIDAVLCLEPGTTENRLRYLHSVLKVPPSPDEAVTPLHATLGDFVFNRYRSHSFGLHIDQEQYHQGVILKILKESMVRPASERLNDCRGDWFRELYDLPLWRFADSSPAFRTSLASQVREVQGSGVTLWTPITLTQTYHVSLDALIEHSSLFALKDYLSWRSLEKKRRKEVSRRLRTYVADMGFTGRMLVFIHLVPDASADFGEGFDTRLLESLPDPNIVVTQNLTGLALPYSRIQDYDHTDPRKVFAMFAEAFVDPNFLETFFTFFPWNDFNGPGPYDLFARLSHVLFRMSWD